MIKCLITGGAGFIGSNLAKKLLEDGYSVRILDNLSTGFMSNLQSIENDVEFVNGDIRDDNTVSQAMNGMDYVFHHAALSSVPQSVADPISNNNVNISGTLNILKYANKFNIQRVIMASSSAIYGDSPELPKSETMPANPLSPYAVSKLTGEYYGQVFNNLYDIETVSLRYFNVFGPNQDPKTEYSAVIPKFIEIMLNDQIPTIYDDGTQSRDFVYIDNIIHANMLAMKNKNAVGKIYNVGGLSKTTVNELFQQLCRILGKNIQPIYGPIRIGDIKHSYADISRIQNEIGYEPLITFAHGLERTLEYYRTMS